MSCPPPRPFSLTRGHTDSLKCWKRRSGSSAGAQRGRRSNSWRSCGRTRASTPPAPRASRRSAPAWQAAQRRISAPISGAARLLSTTVWR